MVKIFKIRDEDMKKITDKKFLKELDDLINKGTFAVNGTTTDFLTSTHRVSVFINHVVQDQEPTDLNIQCLRDGQSILITDFAHGLEFIYTKMFARDISGDEPQTIWSSLKGFVDQHHRATKKKASTADKGEWYWVDGSPTYVFKNGGVVDIGTDDGRDCLPCIIGKHEFVWSRTAVAGLGNGDLIEGLQMLEHIHEHYRTIGRNYYYDRL